QPAVVEVASYIAHETTRGAENIARIPRGKDPASVKFIIPQDSGGGPYECIIADSTGKTKSVTTLKAVKPGEEAEIQLRREAFSAGLYTIAVRRAGAPVAQFTFEME